MYQVSQAYKESMKSPVRNHSFMRVALGLINQDAQESAYLENHSKYARHSNFSSIYEKEETGIVYATYEENFFKADGSQTFMPRYEDERTRNGLIARDLFNGSFQFEFKFDSEPKDIKGLSIQFGDSYPTNFSVITSDGVEKTFQNEKGYFETDHVFENTTAITVKINSMLYPNTRPRIYYIKFGLGLVYDNDRIISTESVNSLSAINDNIPEVTFTVTLDNSDNIFNVDNPSSVINFLETGQEIVVSYGYELDNGNIEWQRLHTLYVSEWSANDEQARIEAVDCFRYMSDNYYKGKYYFDGITLYDLAVDVLEDAGVESDKYYLDSYLKTVSVKNPLPIITHKEALQIIANAGRCIMTYDRYGKIKIFSAFIPNYETTSNGTADNSDVSFVDLKTIKSHYATYEFNNWKADGTQQFISDSGNVGYISAQISGSDGKFTQNPVITRMMEATYSCFGIEIGFGKNPPKKFIIRTYLDNTVKDIVNVDNNTSQTYFLSRNFLEFNKLEIEFLETAQPNNRIYVDYISIDSDTDYKIEYDDLIKTPVGTQLEKIKNLQVVRSIYKTTTSKEELMTDEYTYVGDSKLYTFDDAHWPFEYMVTADGTEVVADELINVETGSRFFKIDFPKFEYGTKIKIELSGYKYNISKTNEIIEINNRGVDKVWENPLISDDEHAKKVADWLAEYFNRGIEYELDYRGEPALDCGDIIFQENKYDDSLKTVIEESKLAFNGGLSGNLRTRRKERVVRA